MKICFQFLCRSLKKGKGLNYPQVYSHWPPPSNPAFWLVVTSALSFFPIGPKNDLQENWSALIGLFHRGFAATRNSRGVHFNFVADHFFLASDWLPPSPRPFFQWSAQEIEVQRGTESWSTEASRLDEIRLSPGKMICKKLKCNWTYFEHIILGCFLAV